MYRSFFLSLLIIIAFKGYSQAPATVPVTDTAKTPVSLKEVSVSSYKPSIEFKNGTVVMNVENNPLATGNTVLDLLKMLPGVVLDAQGGITVNGKSGVSFMMNGRLQQIPAKQMLQMLSGMSAESVTNIELMKNPSAKYDAAGTAGIINIVSKKVRVKGFSGNVFENLSYGKQYGSMSAASLNFKSDKLTVFSNVSYLSRDIVTEGILDRTINDGITNNMINARSHMHTYKNVANIKAGAEYEISPKIMFGVNIYSNPSSSDAIQPTTTNLSGGLASYNVLYNNARNTDEYTNSAVSIYALYTPDTNGTQLKFSADYTDFADKYSGINQSRFYNNATEVSPMLGYRNIQDADFRIFTQKLDLTKKIGKAWTLETGVKASFVNNNSNFTLALNDPGTDVYHADTTASNKYNYKEQILAGYVNFIKEWKMGMLQAGVRAEQTTIDAVNKTNGMKVDPEYVDMFPNASFNYKTSEKNSLQFSYSYRIDRPGYDQLNPLRVFNDPLNYSTGNPKLQPQYSHNFSLEYNINNFITNSLSYSHTNNSIYNYSYLDNALLQIDTTINYASSDQLIYCLFIQKQVAKWYNLQASVNGMYGVRKGIINGTGTDIPTIACFVTANNDFMLPKGYKLQLNAVYYTPFKDGIQDYYAHGSVDMALQKRFFKNKLSATIGVYDLFFSDYVRAKNILPGQSVYFSQQMDSRRVRLILNYRFGNMRVDRKVHIDNDESKRIKKAS